jgi:hypothetical protein
MTQCFDQMEKVGCIPKNIIYTILMHMYEVQVKKAMEILEHMCV